MIQRQFNIKISVVMQVAVSLAVFPLQKYKNNMMHLIKKYDKVHHFIFILMIVNFDSGPRYLCSGLQMRATKSQGTWFSILNYSILFRILDKTCVFMCYQAKHTEEIFWYLFNISHTYMHCYICTNSVWISLQYFHLFYHFISSFHRVSSYLNVLCFHRNTTSKCQELK